MRSEHVDRFNHDEDAADYDEDVRDESHPIRAGYAATLAWVADQVRELPEGPILELGSGTGNLTRLLPPDRSILCVDVSEAMQAVAERKGGRPPNLLSVTADILEVFDRPDLPQTWAGMASTYALHHLTTPEKSTFLDLVAERLAPGGVCAIGDLMLDDERDRADHLARLRAVGTPAALESAEAIEDEFFWLISEARAAAREAALHTAVKRFSPLSAGLAFRHSSSRARSKI